MEEDNVALVRRISELVNRSYLTGQPVPGLFEPMSPRLRIDASRRIFNPGVYEGHEGLRRVLREVWEAWEGFTELVERIVGTGDTVVVLASIRGRGRASGVEVAAKAALVWTVRDGLVEAVELFSDQDEALRSVGLSG